MKILFDCDVVIDIWGNTQDLFASFLSFDTTLSRGFTPCITATSVVNIGYVLAARKYLDKKAVRESIGGLLQAFDVVDVATSDCRLAFESEMGDYEDALVAYTAKRSGVDFVVTRNKRDFLHSPVPALTPEEFVRIYKPEYLEYEMVDL